jgi:serine protease AprX
MRASQLQLNNFIAVAIVCILLIGAAAAQTMEKDVKKDEKKVLKQENPKITSDLEEKIASVKTEEELPVIIFFKKKEETGAAKALAQSAATSAVESKGGRVEHRYGLVDAISAKMPAGKIAGLAASENIERIYYDEIISLPPPQPVEPALTNSTQTIGANYVWETLGYTGTGINVSVIDSGINYNHPDLGGGWGNRVIGGYNFVDPGDYPMDDYGHGTHVAGIIAANGSIKGVAPDASLLAVKVLDSTGRGYSSDVISGIDWSVANGADIISMSLSLCHFFPQPNDEFDVLNIVSDAAVDRGIVVVVAAGNYGPGTGTISSPGSSKKVITVGASNSQSTVTIDDDTIASFSNRGPSAFGRLDPDVVAPGVSINSTNYTVPYSLMSGTSMSTPHVSGAAALLLQKNPSLTPAEVRRILMQTASNLTASNIHVFEKGAGIINVTKALTYNISATIKGDDRWEESVLPGFTALAKLDLTNNNNYPVTFGFSLEGATDLEGDNSLASSNFSLPDSVVVPAMTATTVDISFTAPINAKPAVYGGTLIISNSTDGALRIPIVITIPLVGTGSIQGTVDDASFSYLKGDWIYYKLRSYNGTTLKAYLNWTDSNDDLDLYLLAPNGEEVNYSELSSGVSEVVTLNNTVYDEYWVAVHAWNLNGGGSYYLNVSYPTGTRGNLEVSPASWQGVIASDEVRNITFSITNDATPKSNLNLNIKKLMEGGNNFSTGTINNTDLDYYELVWDVASSGMNLENTRYMNVTLRWVNSTKNLDLILGYYNGTQWVDTRFISAHDNPQLKQAWEGLENVDIQHYLKSYPNFGIGISNNGSPETYNLTINFTDIAPWSGASVNETSISLSSGQSKLINVTINGYSLNQNITDLVFSIQNSTEDYAAVPVRVNLLDRTPPVVTDPRASPSRVPADGKTNTTLSVNVTDPSGIKSVTVNLSHIGGIETQMILVSGTSITGTYAVNISVPTVPATVSEGIYNLPVNATDNYNNSNTSVNISLEVFWRPNITAFSIDSSGKLGHTINASVTIKNDYSVALNNVTIVLSGLHNTKGYPIYGTGAVNLDAGNSTTLRVLVYVPASADTGNYAVFADAWLDENYPDVTKAEDSGPEVTSVTS